MKKKIHPREIHFIAVGIRLGIGLSAGILSTLQKDPPRKVAAMLDHLSAEDELVSKATLLLLHDGDASVARWNAIIHDVIALIPTSISEKTPFRKSGLDPMEN